ncbi:hypothetical protein L1787_13405 [Acuticoccus sp. M5D2P5]|uniref:hypothetical protein n=1 Tax=Acuticoccus kalidii TaxID=2910977 RepID=UPI001F201E83|nr:hypothetical protein [Acuticoccus kalidii]MCF3934401.1 hypothetical protein [Acuticoccus kalidii]
MVDTLLTRAQERINKILGKEAWGVSIGHGTFVTMEFGKEIPGRRPHGEWHIWIRDAAWRLDKGEKTLEGSNSIFDRKNIQLLNGKIITKWCFHQGGKFMVLNFSSEYRMSVFSDSKDDEFLTLFYPGGIFSFFADGHIENIDNFE